MRWLPSMAILALLLVSLSSSGCVALSFGGKSTEVVTENPETQARLANLEARVQALEQGGFSGPTAPLPPTRPQPIPGDGELFGR